MFLKLFELTFFLENLQYNLFFKNLVIINIFKIFFLEWFLLQIIFFYIVYKILKENNLFKLILLTLYFIIIICIYLSLLQFELFACFLFTSEFVILIFFYVFFLNLNYLNKKLYFLNSININTLILITIIIYVLFLFFFESYFLKFFFEEYLIFVDLYTIYSSFIFNDLIHFYYFFFQLNLNIFVFIGFILFILTLYLLHAIWFFISSNIKKTFYKNTNTYKTSNRKSNQILNFFDGNEDEDNLY